MQPRWDRIALVLAVVASIGVVGRLVVSDLRDHSDAMSAAGSASTSASSPAAGTGPPSPSPSSKPSPAPSPTPASAPASGAASSGVDAALAALAQPLGSGGVSVAATNLSTGASYSYGATSGMVTASVIKLDILEVLLLQHQDRKQLLSDADVSNTTSMIENSDNDTAQTLWDGVGGAAAVTAANQRLGLTATVAQTDGYFGLSTTSAADQVTLMRNLVSGGPLDAASQSYALGLLTDVEPDQRWGVGVVADAGDDFANKNGWLSVDGDQGRWVVGSVGMMKVNGAQVLLAVLTQHEDNEQDGINLIESASKSVAALISPAR